MFKIAMSECSIIFRGAEMTLTREDKKRIIIKQRKQQILDAAREVFSKKGFDKATTAEIAQTAGIAEGTIYNYYQSKRDLLLSLTANFVANESFAKLLEHPPGADDTAFISSIIENRLSFTFDNVEWFFFLFAEVQRDPELRLQYAKQVVSPTLKLAEGYFASRIASGGLRPVNASVTARALAGIVMGLTLLYRIEGASSPLQAIPRQELVSELTNLILNGIQRSGD